MERIEILQGTNPMIAVNVKDVTLVPTFTQTVGEEDVVRHSYFTIRHSDSSFRPLDVNKGELQIEMDSTGNVNDEYGNSFMIENKEDGTGYAEVRLSRSYTRLMHDHDYFFQFNLIDDDGNLFAVGDKPTPIVVRTNLADFREADGE